MPNTFNIEIRDEYLVNPRQATLPEVAEAMGARRLVANWHEVIVTEVEPCDHSALEQQVTNLTAQVGRLNESLTAMRQQKWELDSKINSIWESVRGAIQEEDLDKDSDLVQTLIELGLTLTRDVELRLRGEFNVYVTVDDVPFDADIDQLMENVCETLAIDLNADGNYVYYGNARLTLSAHGEEVEITDTEEC
jgi:hypothetical protein